jgi:hypothetical protein
MPSPQYPFFDLDRLATAKANNKQTKLIAQLGRKRRGAMSEARAMLGVNRNKMRSQIFINCLET